MNKRDGVFLRALAKEEDAGIHRMRAGELFRGESVSGHIRLEVGCIPEASGCTWCEGFHECCSGALDSSGRVWQLKGRSCKNRKPRSILRETYSEQI